MSCTIDRETISPWTTKTNSQGNLARFATVKAHWHSRIQSFIDVCRQKAQALQNNTVFQKTDQWFQFQSWKSCPSRILNYCSLLLPALQPGDIITSHCIPLPKVLVIMLSSFLYKCPCFASISICSFLLIKLAYWIANLSHHFLIPTHCRVGYAVDD